MILSGKSVLDDEGYTCQQWTRGKIAPTSPEGEQKWHKVGQFWFPLSYSVSVIDTATGEVKWVSSKILAPYESSDYTYKTCDDAINDPVDN